MSHETEYVTRAEAEKLGAQVLDLASRLDHLTESTAALASRQDYLYELTTALASRQDHLYGMVDVLIKLSGKDSNSHD